MAKACANFKWIANLRGHMVAISFHIIIGLQQKTCTMFNWSLNSRNSMYYSFAKVILTFCHTASTGLENLTGRPLQLTQDCKKPCAL